MKKTKRVEETLVGIEEMPFEARFKCFSDELNVLMKKWHVAIKERAFIDEQTGTIKAEIKGFDTLTK